MKIRFATLDDIPSFVELARTFQARTRFKDYAFNANASPTTCVPPSKTRVVRTVFLLQ